MPHTKNGKYFKVVNGKRQYNSKYDKAPGPIVLRGKGAYSADRTYKRTKAARRVAKAQPNYEPSFGRSLLTEGGSMLGGIFGMPGLGKSAGSALSNIFGLGSYEVKENVFMEGRLPQMMNVPSGGGTVIRFQEYLGDIITSATPGAFNIDSWVINTANRNTFPFLAQIAVNYEQYQVEGLVYEFRSTSADALNSTNTALGSVLMATQYDVADALFTSKAEMLNYEYSNSVKPSENCMHMIECAPSQTSIPILYTLDGSAPANTDARLYHLGRFNVATIGFQAASVRIGEIHCTYQVRLLKPKLYSALGLDDDYAKISSTDYTNANPFGVTILEEIDNFGVVVTGTTITLAGSNLVKKYRFDLWWNGATPAAIAYPGITVSAGSTILGFDVGGTTAVLNNQCGESFVVTTAGNNIPVVVTADALGVLPTGVRNIKIRIMEVPSAA